MNPLLKRLASLRIKVRLLDGSADTAAQITLTKPGERGR